MRLTVWGVYAVVFPDYRGLSCEGVTSRIHASCPNALAIAALNGPENEELTAKAGVGVGYEWIVTEPGFNAAVYGGLSRALEVGAERVVRLDTAEHDIQLLNQAFGFLDEYDMVVLDLAFDEKTLVRGTPDERLNTVDMPNLTGSATRGVLRLSGAHGYMAFRAEALRAVLPDVAVAQERLGVGVTWGLDTAVALLVANRGYRCKVFPVAAQEVRNRPQEKIDAQLAHTRSWVTALGF